MANHPNKRICRIEEIDEAFLTFELTPGQRAKAGGETITFRKSTQRYKKEGCRQLLSRAEFNKLNPKTGKKRNTAAASRLLGIIFDDDPEWLYETDKTRSPRPEVRERAAALREELNRSLSSSEARFFCEYGPLGEAAALVNEVPLPLFVTAAVVCAWRGAADAAALAAFWNENLSFLRNILPSLTLESLSADAVLRIGSLFTDKGIRLALREACWWLDGVDEIEWMTFSALSVTDGHALRIATTRRHGPALLEEFKFHGATVVLDAGDATPESARAILEGGGLYLFEIPGNQPKLYDPAVAAFENAGKMDRECRTFFRRLDREGLEGRACVVMPGAVLPETILGKWPGLRDGSLIRMKNRSFPNGTEPCDKTRYFMTCHRYEEGMPDLLAASLKSLFERESYLWAMEALWKEDPAPCLYPGFLCFQETLGRLARRHLAAIQKIDEEEQSRSVAELRQEAGATLESGMRWLCRICRSRGTAW